jgi:hypothetical protein
MGRQRRPEGTGNADGACSRAVLVQPEAAHLAVVSQQRFVMTPATTTVLTPCELRISASSVPANASYVRLLVIVWSRAVSRSSSGRSCQAGEPSLRHPMQTQPRYQITAWAGLADIREGLLRQAAPVLCAERRAGGAPNRASGAPPAHQHAAATVHQLLDGVAVLRVNKGRSWSKHTAAPMIMPLEKRPGSPG